MDYIYLDTDERRRFAQVSHEYLIEQLQFTGDESTSTTNTKIKLNFNHPCKELIWVVQPDANVSSSVDYGAQWFNYTDDFDPTYKNTSAYSVEDAYGGVGGVVAPYTSNNDLENLAGGMPGIAAGGANRVFVPTTFEGGDNPVSTAKIQLNGHDRFAEMDGRYFNLVQPFQHHENVPSMGINVYSFGLKPEEHQPSGTCNMSRIDSATLNLTLTQKTINSGGARTAKVRVYAVKSAAKSSNELVLVNLLMRHFPIAGTSLGIHQSYEKMSGFGRSAANLGIIQEGSETEWKWVLLAMLKIQSNRLINITTKLQLQCVKNNVGHGGSCLLQLVCLQSCCVCHFYYLDTLISIKSDITLLICI